MTSRDWSRAPTAGYLVWHLTLKWRGALGRALAPLGVTPAQYSLLASLYGLSRRGARPSQRELADFTGLEPMFVSKLTRALERSGLVARAAHPADPRALQLTLTDRGVETTTAAITIVRDLHDQLLAPLGGRTSTRSAALMKVLQSLIEHAETLERAPATRPSKAISVSAPPRRRRRT